MRARASLSKARKPVRVSAERHNAVLEAAQKRVDALEGRLARVVEGVIERAGARAAHRFALKATNHLTAAAGNADISAASTMICLRPRPDEAEAIADPDGDAPETLHVTLAYLGKTDQPLAEIAEALRPVAASLAPLAGVVGGYGIFDPPGVGILLPDVRGLVELRVAVTEALLEARIDYGRQHGFAAHITVHSDPTNDDQDATLARAAEHPLHFDALHVVRGNAEEVVIPLVGVPSLTAAAEPPAWSAPFPDEIIDIDQLVKELLAKTEPVRKAMIEQTMTAALEQAGLSWDVTNPLTAKVLAQSASQIRSIAETTQLNVMRIIQSAYQNGLTIPQTATAIRAGMKVASSTRATLIARTELAGAANGGSLAATQLVAGATGENYSKSWRTAPGAKYPRHEDYEGLDGQTVALDGVFQVGEDELQFPGDPDGDPSEVCNCRCVLSYGPPIATGEDAPSEPMTNQDVTSGVTGIAAAEVPKVVVPWAAPEVVTSDLKKAAKELAAGKNVLLKQGSNVSTFIDDLGKLAADAHKAGAAAPDLNLAKVSVEGTNLFAQDSLGIPRIDMPQLVGIPVLGSPASRLPTTLFEGKVSQWRDISQPFFQSLKDQGVSVTAEEVNPETLRATQNELNGAKIADLMDKIEAGTAPTDEPVIISSDNYILDGHHRWAASVGSDFKTGVDIPSPIKVERIDEPITTLLQQARDYATQMGIPPQSAFQTEAAAAVTPAAPVVVDLPKVAAGIQPVARAVDIGITPFRAGEDNAVGFYSSAKYKQFERDLQESAQAYGVHVDAIEKVTGIWEGDTEPSVSLRVSATTPEPTSDVYKGQHTAPGPDFGAPMNDVTGKTTGGAGIYPPDVYDKATQLRYYGSGAGGEYEQASQEAFDAINRARDDPNAMVTVYRAVPGDVAAINPGDWVTPSKKYAEIHAASNLGEQEGAHIVSMQVPASQLWTDGNAIEEWGWVPPNFEQIAAEQRFRAYAANLAQAYNQDGVLLFTPDSALSSERGRLGETLARGGPGGPGPGVSFTETTDYGAFNGALGENARPDFLTVHSPEDLAKNRVFLSADGKAGFSLTPEGDLQNVFRNEGGVKGAGRMAVHQAVLEGARTLDAYDGFLPDLYQKEGFEVVGRMPWNDEFAPPGWDYEKYGRPDVVFMAQSPLPGTEVKTFTDWDEAKAYSRQVSRAGAVAPTGGESLMATFRSQVPEAQVTAAMKKVGLPGGRFTNDGRLQVIGSGADFANQLVALGKELGEKYDIARGAFDLLDRDAGDYKAALDAFSHPKAVAPVTIPEKIAPELPPVEHGGPIVDDGTPRTEEAHILQPDQLQWIRGLNASDQKLIDAWTRYGSDDVNAYLSGKLNYLSEFDSNDAVAKAAADMARLVDSAPPLPPNTTLYRAVSAAGVDPSLLDRFAEIGNEVIDANPNMAGRELNAEIYRRRMDELAKWAQQKYPLGRAIRLNEPKEFASLTATPDTAATFGNQSQPGLIFRVENAKTGAPIWPFSAQTDEAEVIAPPDTTYRVKSVTINPMQMARTTAHEPGLGETEDHVVVTVEEVPPCSGLTAAAGAACSDIGIPVRTGEPPMPTLANGNPFPGQPRDVAREAEDHRAAAIARYAAAHNMTPEAYQAAAEQVVKDYVSAHPQIRVRMTQESLESVLRDGRFKSEFELPGITRTDVVGRAETERKMFGYDSAVTPQKRPIYGYLAGTANEGGAVGEYGDVIVNIDPAVNARATFTMGDSYRPALEGNLSPTALSSPGLGSWAGNFDILKAAEDGSLPDVMQYVEVEIHGGLTTADIGTIAPDSALIQSRQSAEVLKDAVEALTSLSANYEGEQVVAPPDLQGLPEQPATVDVSKELRDIAKKANERTATLEALMHSVAFLEHNADFLGDIPSWT